MAKKKMSEEEREKLGKMRRESDAHITVSRNGKKLIDNGKLTVFGKRELKAKAVTKEEQRERIIEISRKEKEKLRSKLFKKDGGRCHYCGIEEGDFIEIWRGFYGEKRGKKLEVDRKDNEKGYNEENCVLSCPICNNAKSDKFTYEEFLKVGDIIKEIWQQRKKKKEEVNMKIAKDILGLAAEFAVASELCKRNIYAQLTLGLRKRTDILVETERGMLRIQVKGKQGRTWPGCQGIYGENIALVFVDFEDKEESARPDFYVLTVADWKRLLERELRATGKVERGEVTINENNIPSWNKGKYQGMSIKPEMVKEDEERWEKIKSMLG